MTDKIKLATTLTYGGVEVGYVEETNRWRFELRGRERNAESLKQAKEWIDKPEPEKKNKKPFERFKVWSFRPTSWHEKREVVTVTSAAEARYSDGVPTSAWVLSESGERSKEGVHYLYLMTVENEELFKQYYAATKEKRAFEAKAEAILKKLIPVKFDAE